MSDSRKWFSPRDEAARLTFEALQDRIGPIIADLLPGFRLTYCGFNRRPDDLRFIDGRDEIQITLHLLPLGESWAIEQQLRSAAMPELLDAARAQPEGGKENFPNIPDTIFTRDDVIKFIHDDRKERK